MFVSTKWCFNSRIVNAVENCQEHIISIFFLTSMKISGNQMIVVLHVATVLKSFKIVFLLSTFSPLFAQIYVIYNLLWGEHIVILTCLNVIRDFEIISNLSEKDLFIVMIARSWTIQALLRINLV